MQETVDIPLKVHAAKTRQFEYVPQPDITVYELALLIPAIAGVVIGDYVNGLPDSARRHFIELTE